MTEERVVGQPLTEITIFQCPECQRTFRNDYTRLPYQCPFGCPGLLVVLRTEWEERGTHVHDRPEMV